MKNNILLNIKKFNLLFKNKKILNNLNLIINQNEIHILMGPNGSGKTTLSKCLTGHFDYRDFDGSITFLNENLLKMSPEDRSLKGLFLAFQYPPEIPGVTNYDVLRLIFNKHQQILQRKEFTPLEFFDYILPFCEELKISQEFLSRNFNEGFSGGEKKKNEILQMCLINPKLMILDEIDSGLDLDAIKIIFKTITKYKNTNSSLLIITHNPKILQYLNFSKIHILVNGTIVESGNFDVIEKLERSGYNY